MTRKINIRDILQAKGVEILRIAAKHGARNVRIFVSVVRGEAGSAGCYTFRHSFAAHLKEVNTTMTYPRILNNGDHGVRSPVDGL